MHYLAGCKINVNSAHCRVGKGIAAHEDDQPELMLCASPCHDKACQALPLIMRELRSESAIHCSVECPEVLSIVNPLNRALWNDIMREGPEHT